MPNDIQNRDTIIEKMIIAYDSAKDQDFNASPSERRCCMAAAYRVGRAQVITERDAHWGKAIDNFLRYCMFAPDMCKDMLSDIQSRLAQIDKLLSPEERVTIREDNIWFLVQLDGQRNGPAFNRKIDAERYAIGLRKELETKQ